MIKTKITNCGNYNGLPLLPYNGPNSGYYDAILEKTDKRLNNSLFRTSKCLLVRLVVRYPSDMQAYNDNQCFQYFMEEYRRFLNDKLLHYVWVREQHSSHNPHYHLALFFDGNKMQYFSQPSQAIYFWKKAIAKVHNFEINGRGLIHICEANVNDIKMNHGMMIHRNNPAMKQEAFKLCSYLAKINTKGSAPKNVREYGSSLLRK
jgi:hypothetical protein